MERLNIVSAENLDGRIDVGRAVGSSEMLVFVYDLAPGQSSSPYHHEYDEEWLLVVGGAVLLRAPDASTRWSAATSSASRAARTARTR